MATAQRRMRDMSRLGSQRGYIYGFLATTYRKELTPELLGQLRDSEFLEALVGIGNLLKDDLSSLHAEGLLDNIAVEYTRLFLGPGQHISPYESVHFTKDGGKCGSLWGGSSVEVKRLVESLGPRFQKDCNSIPDHIGDEMELMQKITACESQAWTEEDIEGALRVLNVEKRFVEDHLSMWMPRFYEKVAAQAEFRSCKEIAKITMEFIEFEKENMDSYIDSVKAL